MTKELILTAILGFSIIVSFSLKGFANRSDHSRRETTVSFDGVEIVYSVQGKGEPALVFIHGGFADRTFWSEQMKYFGRFRKVIAVDLAGHGESGENRKDWGIDAFAEDVKAAIREEKVQKAVLIGNSLGGPVGLKTAHLIPDAILAVVAVDTLQDIGRQVPSSYFLDMAKAYRNDFAKTMKELVRALFHPDTYPELMSWTEKRMMNHSPEMAASMMESFADFDMAKLVNNLSIPIRCINGDLIPTQVEKNRAVHADFDADILPNTGHYPMLENPALFNEHLEEILKKLNIK